MKEALTEKPNAEVLPELASAGVILNGHYLAPPTDTEGKLWTRANILIHSTPEVLYALWRDLERAPTWQEQIAKVRKTGEKTSHWTMRTGSETIEWDSQILCDEPGKRIAWTSIGDESHNAGEVIFENSPGERATMVTVLQEFRLGRLTSMWESLLGRNPKQSVIENLRHFKALAETGEIPRTQGQPHGPRGVVARLKASAYGETIETPSGAQGDIS